jgi:N-acetylglutamate synthase-like GNAT family acetyltransferase
MLPTLLPYRSAEIHSLRPQHSADAVFVLIRAAVALDQGAITRLVQGERLNPNGLAWQNFIVAVVGGAVVGAVQMRQHDDDSLELGSLVVHREHRRRGIAGRMITVLLNQHPSRVHVITHHKNAVHYRRWGFRPIALGLAAHSVQRNYCLGQLASLIALLKGRWPRRLAVLRRG